MFEWITTRGYSTHLGGLKAWSIHKNEEVEHHLPYKKAKSKILYWFFVGFLTFLILVLYVHDKYQCDDLFGMKILNSAM